MKINIHLLLIILIIGIGLLYIVAPKPNIIIKLPNSP
jgi:hypothetical protein